MKSKKINYFENFLKMVEGTMAAARLLDEIVREYDSQYLTNRMKEMHEIEHSNDVLVHDTLKFLVSDFLPPLEREDINNLTEKLDNPTDLIEDVLFALYMYSVQTIRPEVLKFCKLIVEASDALYDAMVKFSDFKKYEEEIRNPIIFINQLEEEGDRLHIEAMRNLYQKERNHKEVLIWSRIYDRLEYCMDSIESVANSMESIMMNNL